MGDTFRAPSSLGLSRIVRDLLGERAARFPMSRFFALTTRGLEALTAQEVTPLVDRIIEVAYRRVEVEHDGELAPLLTLRTADDLFVAVGAWTDVGHTRAELDEIRARCANLDLAPALAACRTLRPIPEPPSFAVTANFVGKRNYSVPELKAVVGQAVESQYGWRYTKDDAGARLNLRLFIEHTRAYVGLRLGEAPLHRRPYKVAQIPGSLKPTVAAAMVILAVNGHPDQQSNQFSTQGNAYSHTGYLLDPCCGAGTIIIEAAQVGLRARGGDIDPDAIDAARTNWRALLAVTPNDALRDVGGRDGRSATINSSGNVTDDPFEVWDAQTLPIPAQSVDYVICNLPWGRQTTVDSRLEAFYRRVCAEIERVLVPGGRAVLLTSLPHLLHLSALDQIMSLEISLFGQTPQIVCYEARSSVR